MLESVDIFRPQIYFCMREENQNLYVAFLLPILPNLYNLQPFQLVTNLVTSAQLVMHRSIRQCVTASSGTAISTDFATLTCSEILSKILIRCVTWH